MAGWLRKLLGGQGEAAEAAVEAEVVEYNGYLIRPTPYQEGREFQTAGVIEKNIGGETRRHSFIRAEKHTTRDEAVSFSLAKARQIIDGSGDRIFNE